MDFSHEIKRIRIELLLSQMEFAEKLGVSFSTVNRWETGKNKPNFKTLKNIDSLCKENGIDFNMIKDIMIERGNNDIYSK